MPPKMKTTDDKRDPSEAKKLKLELDKETGSSDSDGVAAGGVTTSSIASNLGHASFCKLDSATQDLIEFIFDEETFNKALQDFTIDTNKMSLDKISLSQIDKGFEVLVELEKAIKADEKEKFIPLTKKFFTVIPHKLGTEGPPEINSAEGVKEKYYMLNTLADIEIAQKMLKDKHDTTSTQDNGKVKHPLDVNYGLLNCELKHLDIDSKEYKILQKYVKAKRGNAWKSAVLTDVWTVNREGEATQFAQHNELGNRKLLWHGTHTASTVAVLKTGLHIKPHSGGRIGHGIYFGEEVNKFFSSAIPVQGKAVMFLCEVALGWEKSACRDCPDLSSPPDGCNSVVALGDYSPDEKRNATIEFDGKDVIVPIGKTKRNEMYKKFNSWFYTSEFAVFREDQHRIRYLLLFDDV